MDVYDGWMASMDVYDEWMASMDVTFSIP